jgi:pimeloyl-ACP methyl ester carboxylesterase
MTKVVRNHVTDLRGASRMVVDAIAGVTGLIEAIQTNLAEKPTRFAGAIVGAAVNGTTSVVYKSIRGVTRAVGGAIDLALGAVAPALGHIESSPARESVVAALNGVLGDYLAKTGNPLAVAMNLRREGKALELTREGLAATIQVPSSKVLVLVHGLCRNDRRWECDGHNHGTELARDLSYTAAYLHYNTGLHISTNGRAFAQILEALVAAWPVPLKEVSILAHSMGGLVARSAHHYASATGHAWPRKLRKLVFLGTPHHGAPFERAGNKFELLLEKTPYTAPFALLGKVRSAGITDLRHGYVLEEDWKGHDRFANRADSRRPLPLPKRVQCYTIAATLGHAPTSRRAQPIGDGLVPIRSALGDHRDSRLKLAFPQSHQWTASGTSHFGLLLPGPVYERIRGWFGE